jgi:hypothetical protein
MNGGTGVLRTTHFDPKDPEAWPLFEDRDLSLLELHECGQAMVELAQLGSTAEWYLAKTRARMVQANGDLGDEEERTLKAHKILYEAIARRYTTLQKAISRLLTQKSVELENLAQAERRGNG